MLYTATYIEKKNNSCYGNKVGKTKITKIDNYKKITLWPLFMDGVQLPQG